MKLKNGFWKFAILSVLLAITLVACDTDLGTLEEEADGGADLQLGGKNTRKVTLLGGGELEGYDFIEGNLVMICHQTLSAEVPLVTLRVEESTLPEHEAHGDIIPAPPEGCGDDLAPLPETPPDQAQATNIPNATTVPGATAVPGATTAPGTVEPGTVQPTNEPDTGAPGAQPGGQDVVTACDQGLTIAETMIGQADEDVIEVLYRAGLLDILNNPNRSYIVFIPEDVDFEDMEDDEYTDVVLAHVAVANAPLTDGELLNMGTLQTLSGDTVTIASDDEGLVLNDEVRVDGVLFTACNGIVYTVDDYLVDVTGDDDEGDGDKVEICHRTNSERNPYREITVDESALDAHEDHGDIIPVPAGGCPSGDDDGGNGRGNNGNNGRGRGNDGGDDD